MRTLNALLSTSALLVISFSQAFAAPPGESLNITEVFVDDQNNPTVITIVGENLLFGTHSPTVTLGGIGTLSIISITETPTNTIIQAAIPPIPAGDYRLVVAGEDGHGQTDAYDFTIGAVGPQGEQGIQGEQGEQGPPGQDGLNGVNGVNGQDGANCYDGISDSVADCIGPPGPEGPPGPVAAINTSCQAGQYVSGFDVAGAIVCSGPTVECPCFGDFTTDTLETWSPSWNSDLCVSGDASSGPFLKLLSQSGSALVVAPPTTYPENPFTAACTVTDIQGIPKTPVRRLITSEEYDLCTASILDIAAEDGVNACGSSFVFTTTGLHSGNLGGIEGGDAICQAAAEEAGRTGTWTAWLSADSVNARDRLSDAGAVGPFVNTAGGLVATNLTDLTNGDISAFIRDENGNSSSSTFVVWTGTAPDGTSTGENCSNWTSSSSTSGGTAGHRSSRSSNWTAQTPPFFEINCAKPGHLYCFQSATTP